MLCVKGRIVLVFIFLITESLKRKLTRRLMSHLKNIVLETSKRIQLIRTISMSDLNCFSFADQIRLSAGVAYLPLLIGAALDQIR